MLQMPISKALGDRVRILFMYAVLRTALKLADRTESNVVNMNRSHEVLYHCTTFVPMQQTAVKSVQYTSTQRGQAIWGRE